MSKNIFSKLKNVLADSSKEPELNFNDCVNYAEEAMDKNDTDKVKKYLKMAEQLDDRYLTIVAEKVSELLNDYDWAISLYKKAVENAENDGDFGFIAKNELSKLSDKELLKRYCSGKKEFIINYYRVANYDDGTENVKIQIEKCDAISLEHLLINIENNEKYLSIREDDVIDFSKELSDTEFHILSIRTNDITIFAYDKYLDAAFTPISETKGKALSIITSKDSWETNQQLLDALKDIPKEVLSDNDIILKLISVECDDDFEDFITESITDINVAILALEGMQDYKEFFSKDILLNKLIMYMHWELDPGEDFEYYFPEELQEDEDFMAEAEEQLKDKFDELEE